MKTVIVGATTNTDRYAYLAAEKLTRYGHEIVPVGIKKGAVFGKEILSIREQPAIPGVDTITLYIGARHQHEHINYLLSLKPRRIIFNPGTENDDFMQKTQEMGIEVVEGCTLVMLGAGTF